jgi:hypothetical protein
VPQNPDFSLTFVKLTRILWIITKITQFLAKALHFLTH